MRDAALDAAFPRVWPCWVRIVLDDGTRLERRVEHPLGDPENFPSAAVLREKLARLAGRVLPPARIEAVSDLATRLVDAPDVRPLLDLVGTGN